MEPHEISRFQSKHGKISSEPWAVCSVHHQVRNTPAFALEMSDDLSLPPSFSKMLMERHRNSFDEDADLGPNSRALY